MVSDIDEALLLWARQMNGTSFISNTVRILTAEVDRLRARVAELEAALDEIHGGDW